MARQVAYAAEMERSSLAAASAALSTFASKLRYYAERLEQTGERQHQALARLLRKHQKLIEGALN